MNISNYFNYLSSRTGSIVVMCHYHLMKDSTGSGTGSSVPDDAPPAGAVQVILFLGVQPDVLLWVQLQPVEQALPVPAYRLQPHLLWLLLVYHRLELQVVIELTLT